MNAVATATDWNEKLGASSYIHLDVDSRKWFAAVWEQRGTLVALLTNASIQTL